MASPIKDLSKALFAMPIMRSLALVALARPNLALLP
jgi:hypothetical protein